MKIIKLKLAPNRNNTQISNTLNHNKLETTKRYLHEYLHESEFLKATLIEDRQPKSNLKAIILFVGD